MHGRARLHLSASPGRRQRRPSVEPAKTYAPGLVEFMIAVQSRHAKLWLAGNARNWELADYQVDELKELLEDIAKRFPVYKDMPVGQMIESTTMAPIGDVEAAIKANDRGQVRGGVRQAHRRLQCLPRGANRRVHRDPAAGGSAFPNQSFAPTRK